MHNDISELTNLVKACLAFIVPMYIVIVFHVVKHWGDK